MNRFLLPVLYALNFIFTVHLVLPAYLESSFLGTFTSGLFVSVLFALGAFITLLLMPLLPFALRRIGNFKLALSLGVLEIISLLILAGATSPLIISIFFVLKNALSTLMYYCLDIFLEKYTRNETTGGTRGFFLTGANLAWVITPAIAGIMAEQGGYKVVFVASAIVLLLFIVGLFSLVGFKDPHYEYPDFRKSLSRIARDKNLSIIAFSNILFRIFSAWMVIYSPVYLHEQIGFSWDEIGILFSLILIPYLLTEIPAGILADRRWGEKELLLAGLLIAGISTASLAFITSSSFLVWMVALFFTRIGISLVEIMTESHFFKHIHASDASLISVFRLSYPLAFTFAPLLAAGLLFFLPPQSLFLILGGMLVLGVFVVLPLVDTR